MKQKKAQIGQLQGLVIGLVAVALVLVVGFLLFAEAKTQIGTIESIDTSNATQCQTSVTCNATTTTVEAMATVPNWLKIIVITVIGALLIGLVALFRAR